MAEGVGLGPTRAGISSMTSAYKAGPFTNSGNPLNFGCQLGDKPSTFPREPVYLLKYDSPAAGYTGRATSIIFMLPALPAPLIVDLISSGSISIVPALHCSQLFFFRITHLE